MSNPDPSTVIAQLTPAQGASLRMSLDALSGFSTSDKTKVETAVDLAEHVLGSEQFRQAVLDFTYQGQRQFVQNYISDADGTVIEDNLTNERIYEIIQAGEEHLTGIAPEIDHVANLDLNLYTAPWYNKWGTVGYGNPGEPEIYMNWYYFNSYEYADVSDNVTHEWTHKLGFDHDYNSTARRPYSVPYGIGCIMDALAAGQSAASCSN
jgi:hypothetical protein